MSRPRTISLRRSVFQRQVLLQLHPASHPLMHTHRVGHRHICKALQEQRQQAMLSSSILTVPQQESLNSSSMRHFNRGRCSRGLRRCRGSKQELGAAAQIRKTSHLLN